MAKETKSARAVAGQKAWRDRVKAAHAAGKKTMNVGGRRIPISSLRDAPRSGGKTKAHTAKSKAAGKAIAAGAAARKSATQKSIARHAAKQAKRDAAAAKHAAAVAQKAAATATATAITRSRTAAKKTTKKGKTMAKPKKSKKSRSAAAKKAAKTRAANKRKHEAAGRKAAKTRARHEGKRAKSPKGGKRKGGSKKRKGTKRPTAQVRAMTIPRGAKKIIAADRRRGRRGHRRARDFAMDNPLSTMEIISGGLAMLFGLAVADIGDRYIATHALTASTSGTTTTYTDTPTVTSATGMASFGLGLYPGMKNGAAVIAPMNLTRWVYGGAISILPFVAAAYTKQPTTRTALQLFGFGALARIGGKALIDLFAGLLGGTSLGQQLYVNELAATAQYQVATAGSTTIVLPGATSAYTAGSGTTGSATGLARPPQGECPVCAQRHMVDMTQPPPPPPEVAQSPATPGSMGAPPQLQPRNTVRENPLAWSNHITEGAFRQ